MTAQTAAARQRTFEAKKRAAKQKLLRLWTNERYVKRIKAFAKNLNDGVDS